MDASRARLIRRVLPKLVNERLTHNRPVTHTTICGSLEFRFLGLSPGRRLILVGLRRRFQEVLNHTLKLGVFSWIGLRVFSHDT